MAVRGFRTKIGLHVALLVLLSALITDAVVIMVAQSILVRNHVHDQRLLMETIGRSVLVREAPGPNGAASAAGLLETTHWPEALVVGRDGRMLYTHGKEPLRLSRLRAVAAAALRTGAAQHENLGLSWAVFWWHPEAALIAVPLGNGAPQDGSIAAVVSLTPLYARLRQYNKPVFVYIALNTLVLSMLGLYRIFRIYLRPIDRIIRQADEYGRDEDIFFAFRQEDNELNRLSAALNRMLKRISEDKRTLRETVASLKEANEEIKRAQNEIIRAEKMASVGRLAAGIAHEIGNPIGIVLGYLDLIKQPDLTKEEHDDYARRAETEIQRINTIIHQLLNLARPKESALQIVSVHGVISDIAGIMSLQPIMAGIHIEQRLDAPDDRLWADADQLRQVFLNLLLNAADAIRSAGNDSDGRIGIATSCDPAAVMTIVFEDNGQGIADDQIANIFDPFYTTKAPGQGTGLGLAVSYMIVEKMGGTISVQNRPGKGTIFTIRLPLAGRTLSAGVHGATVSEQKAELKT